MNQKRKLKIKLTYLEKAGRLFLLGLLVNLLSFNSLQAQCVIGDLIIEHSACDNLNQFSVTIDFDWAGGADSFSVAGNGNNYGHFSKWDLPITINSPYFIGDGITIYEFVAIDLELPNDCFNWGVIGPVSCGPNNDCGITNITYTILPCDLNDQFGIVIDFDWEYTSDFFTVHGNGVDYGTFSYADVPLTLGPFPGDGTTSWEFGIFDLNFPDCGGWIEPGIITCPASTDCEITNLSIEPLECNNNGTQTILINFEVANSPNNYFDILDENGNILAFFPIQDLPVAWDGFVPGGGDYDYLQICINDTPDCCAEIEFMPLNCTPDCHIYDVVADPTACNPNGIFYVYLSFGFDNTSDFFTVVGNGQNYGTFSYNDLPIELGPFEGNGSVLEFIVQDQSQPDCAAEGVLYSPNCNNGDCNIYDGVAEAGDCNNDGTYTLWIDFEHENATNDYFNVINSNGEVIGYFLLSDLPISVTYGPSNGNFDYIQVCINDNPNCCEIIEFASPNCSGGDCEIFDMAVEVGDCNSDGTYTLWINFEYQNPGNDFFDVINSNGDIIGFFPLNELPVSVTYGPSNGNFDYVQVCINDNPNCCAIKEFETPNCGGNNCEIWDVVVEAYDCDPNGLFLVDLDFNYANTSDSFIVVGNGQNYGTFAYSDLYITLGPFEGNGSVYEFIIKDQNNPDCSAEGILESPNCNNGDCEIFYMAVEVGDCNSDGTYTLWIDFEYQNPGNDFFDVIDSNGDIIGFFPLNELPVSVTYGPSSGNFDYVQVCINDNPNCCAIKEFETPNCGGNNCEIWDVVVEAYDCDPNGLFLVDIDFNYANTSDSFIVVGNGQNYGTFAYSDLYITLGPFEGNGSVYEFIIKDQNNPDCSAEGILESPNCNNGDCEIFDMVVEVGDCNNDGTYTLWIDFEYQNPGNDFFDVIDSNGDIIGFFPLNELPVSVTYGPSNGNFDYVQVCINDNPNCCAIKEFETPNCNNGDCDISDLNVYPLDCNPDGTYSILILFDYENVNSDFFDVYANGDYLGSYEYDNLPLSVQSFPSSGNANDVLTVCDNDSEICCATVEFEALDCDACEIYDVVATPSDCDSDDNFMVNLNFESVGGGDLGFMVLGNGNNYGIFDYADLPISLGPFAGDGTTVYEFIIVDLVNVDCIGYTELDPVLCGIPPPVWPGDINTDFISNNFDLLNLGVAFGETGPARPQTNIDWMSWEGENWTQSFADGVNMKHADCNGDGLVNNTDLTAIDLNYNKVHGDVIPYAPIDISPDDPPFYIDLPTVNEVTLGQAFVAPIILGSEETPVESIYGIAFTVEYDPTMMDEAGVYVETGTSWLGEQGDQLININKNFSDDGMIDVAITRIDHNNTTGFGTVSYFIGIIDDIAGKTELTINIKDVVAITYEQERVPLYASSSVIDLTTGINKISEMDVTVFPNPANETVNILTENNTAPEFITVYNTLGQIVTQVNTPDKWQRIDVSSWSDGIYFIDLQYADGRISKKVKVTK